MTQRFNKAIGRCLILTIVALITITTSVSQQAGAATCDNARVIQMTESGLGDAIIVARIKTSQCNFSLTDEDLLSLSQSGVSDQVIAAMLEASMLTSPIVSVDDMPLEVHTMGQGKIGGRFGRFITMGIKSVKWKAYLQGSSASVCASRRPNILFELPFEDTIDNYILVKMDKKKDRRELEMGSAGGVVGAKTGVRAQDTKQTNITDLGGNRYQMVPTNSLKSGEYILYIVGSADTIRGIYGSGYDFCVD